MKKILYIVLLFSMIQISSVRAEGIGIGLSTIYNFQTESLGAGLRFNIKPSNMFRIVPQAAYYPSLSFNKIQEYYVGLGLELNVFKIKKYNFYLLAHSGYNGWLNAETSLMKDAEYNNYVLEAGGGISKNTGCVRPFLEYRYNGRWKETNLSLGLLFVFGCNKKGFKHTNKRRRKAVSCPAYY